LTGADLGRANFFQASLYSVNLRWARLDNSNFVQALVSGDTNLNEADLSKANLSEANFNQTNLGRANISEAKLCNTKTPWGIDNTGC